MELHRLLKADPVAYRFERALTIRTLESYSQEGRWQERIIQLEREAAARSDLEYIEAIFEHNDQMRQLGSRIIAKGEELLSAIDPNRARTNDAVRAIVEGLKLQERGLGAAASTPSGGDELAAHIRTLSDVDLELIISEIKASAATTSAHREVEETP